MSVGRGAARLSRSAESIEVDDEALVVVSDGALNASGGDVLTDVEELGASMGALAVDDDDGIDDGESVEDDAAVLEQREQLAVLREALQERRTHALQLLEEAHASEALQRRREALQACAAH